MKKAFCTWHARVPRRLVLGLYMACQGTTQGGLRRVPRKLVLSRCTETRSSLCTNGILLTLLVFTKSRGFGSCEVQRSFKMESVPQLT
jgi:hypothetical protein